MVIGLDLGATNVRAGVVDAAGGVVVSRAERVYDRNDGPALLDQLIRIVSELHQAYPQVSRAGIVCPGQVDRHHGVLLHPVNLRGWGEIPLGSLVAEATGLEVSLDNDAVGAALAEGWIGRARAASSYLVLTLGTGVGCGVVIDEAVFRGARGFGCEWGHLPQAARGSTYRCGCGNWGCIETFCSATALVHLARAQGLDIDSAHQVCGMAASDDRARRALEAFAGHLALALYTYVLILNPQLIVLGGGLSGSASLFLPQALLRLAELLGQREYLLPPQGVVASNLPDLAGVIGAAYLCMDGGRIRIDAADARDH